MPLDDLEKFVSSKEVTYGYYLAEEFGIPNDVVDEAIQMYRTQGFI